MLSLILIITACSYTPSPATPTPAGPPPDLAATNTPSPAPVLRPTNTPPPTNTPAPTNTPTPPVTTLLLWENLPQAQAEKLNEDIAAFRQIYPRYEIQVHHYDDPQILAAAIIDERVDYDILLGSSTLLAPLQRTGKLQAMNEFFPASFLDGFAGSTLLGATQNGRLWGLPDVAGFHLLLFYNLNLIETPPATNAELFDLARSLKTGSRWGLVLNSRDPLWVVPWLWAYGGWLTDGDGIPTLDSAAMDQALTLHLSWHTGQSPIAPLADHLEARDLFIQGQAAMMIEGEWAIDELTQHADLPWGVALLPTIVEADQVPGPLVQARYWAVGSETIGPRAEAVLAFLEFITQPKRQLAWTSAFGLLPTQRTALTDQQILADPALRISARQLQTGRGVPLSTNLNAILDAMRSPLAQMLAGDLTPAEAATLMQALTR